VQILSVLCECTPMNTFSVHFTRILRFTVLRRTMETWSEVRAGNISLMNFIFKMVLMEGDASSPCLPALLYKDCWKYRSRNNFYSCSYLIFLTADTCLGLYLTIYRRNIQFCFFEIITLTIPISKYQNCIFLLKMVK
jgi:hypothetical protein